MHARCTLPNKPAKRAPAVTSCIQDAPSPLPPPPPSPLPQVLSEDSASNVRWLRLDASTLKQQLTSSCDTWVAAFSGLLASLASRQLAGLEEELSAHCAALEGEGRPQQGGEAAPSPGPAVEAGVEQAAAGEEAGAESAVPEGAVAAADASPATALTREQQFEALEALHGRLLGEREGLQERLALCQERYEALVGLQVGAAALVRESMGCGLVKVSTARWLPLLGFSVSQLLNISCPRPAAAGGPARRRAGARGCAAGAVGAVCGGAGRRAGPPA